MEEKFINLKDCSILLIIQSLLTTLNLYDYQILHSVQLDFNLTTSLRQANVIHYELIKIEHHHQFLLHLTRLLTVLSVLTLDKIQVMVYKMLSNPNSVPIRWNLEEKIEIILFISSFDMKSTKFLRLYKIKCFQPLNVRFIQ